MSILSAVSAVYFTVLTPNVLVHSVSFCSLEIDEAFVSSRVDAALSSSDLNTVNEELVSLRIYWENRCVTTRLNASRRTVVSLGRLLRRSLGRESATLILFDVGPNLRYIRREVEFALADQRRREETSRRAALPVVPSRYSVVFDNLRCLAHKIRYGRLHPDYCRILEALRESRESRERDPH